jgi:two-component system response regulator
MGTNVILLIEDNPDDADLARRAFEMGTLKPTVVVARDGVEALDYLFGTGPYTDAPPEAPAVILLDLNLPRVDGLEVLRRLRADDRTKHLPVVVLTSSLRQGDIDRSYDLGANSYLQKPVEFRQFVETADALGAYWLTLNQRVRRS